MLVFSASVCEHLTHIHNRSNYYKVIAKIRTYLSVIIRKGEGIGKKRGYGGYLRLWQVWMERSVLDKNEGFI